MIPSKTQARKAARHLVEVVRSAQPQHLLTDAERVDVERALAVVTAWRLSYAQPLLSVRVSLQSFIRTSMIHDVSISQRHKRIPRIIKKLDRYPNMQITTMGDIGGCRVVVPTLADIDTLRDHARRVWGSRIITLHDYVSRPKLDGYRAIHVITVRHDRRIEVQLRTERQHLWANTVESLSRDYGRELKWGNMPDELAAILPRVSAKLAQNDEAAIPFHHTEIVDIVEEVANG